MPQITVTLSDEAYWELRQIAKGRLSAFVNRAVMDAVGACHYDPDIYTHYIREGIPGARSAIADKDARNKQLYPKQFLVETEEVVESANEKWMREQKEALE